MFSLHPTLERDCFAVMDMSSSLLLLMDDARYLWFILVPTCENDREIREFHDLSRDDQISVLDDMMAVSKAIEDIFNPHKINTGALGNIVSQLHIHIIGRFTADDAWPGPVWGHGQAVKYEKDAHQKIINAMTNKLIT